MKKDFEIIATINTNEINKHKLISFCKHGATIFRVNSSFLTINNISQVINQIRSIVGASVKILVDLPGYKIRFLFLSNDIFFDSDSQVILKREFFNYPEIIDLIEIGEIIRINDGFNTLVVTKKENDTIFCVARGKGVIRKGRGLHIGSSKYSMVTKSLARYDIKLLEAIKKCDIDYVGLSFIHNFKDVERVEKMLAHSKIKCIPKIEARESVPNLFNILSNSSMAIVDRGDLSGEIGLESIWIAQKNIISLAKLLDCRIIIATQVMASMVKNSIPNIAEVDSIYNLLNLGVDGVQLSEETSIGDHPVECLNFINDVVKYFKQNHKEMRMRAGVVVWLMGMTSSGKTTTAVRIVEILKKKNVPVVHYDGDEVRDMFGAGHGFAEEDRLKVVKNLTHLANKSASAGFNVIVSALTAHGNARKYIRENIPGLVTVYLKCGKNECVRRDHKGLYKKAMEGKINTVIGFNSPYPVPNPVDLTINTEKKSVDKSSVEIINFLVERWHLISSYWMAGVN